MSTRHSLRDKGLVLLVNTLITLVTLLPVVNVMAAPSNYTTRSPATADAGPELNTSEYPIAQPDEEQASTQPASVPSSGGQIVTKYYFFNGQRVAVRRNGELTYLAGDHLGTTSVALDDQGNRIAEARHLPYGEERWQDGDVPTDYRFTGQRLEGDLGLYHMGARFYDPALGRWLSADTLVPSPGNPQALNRYSYAYNNPLYYVDASGHTPSQSDLEEEYGIELVGEWDDEHLEYLYNALLAAAGLYNSPDEFKAALVSAGLEQIHRYTDGTCGIHLESGYIDLSGSLADQFDTRYADGGDSARMLLDDLSKDFKSTHTILHELVHVLQNADQGNLHQEWVTQLGPRLKYESIGPAPNQPNITDLYREQDAPSPEGSALVVDYAPRPLYFTTSNEFQAEFLAWLATGKAHAQIFALHTTISDQPYIQSYIGSQMMQ